MHRVIREEEPTKPSTKLDTLGDTATDIARRRSATPDLLKRTIRGDLDWIVMKSLEKDRTRRYDTVGMLREDVQRHLHHEPVSAGPPSTWYPVKKYLQRHRTLVTAMAAIAIILVVGIAVSLSLYVRMRNAFYTVAQLKTQIDVDERLDAVRQLHAQGRYAAALQELQGAAESMDLGPKGRLLKAQSLIELKRLDEAKAELMPLIQADRGIAANAHYLLARANIGVDEALVREHEALAASIIPETADAFFLRATIAETADQALEWLNRAIALDPGHYESLKGRALIHYSRVEDEAAIEDVAPLISLRPADSLGYALRAVLRRDAGRLQDALVDHQRAIRLSEGEAELVEALQERQATYMALHDYPSALADVQHVADLRPDAVNSRLQIVICLCILKDYGGIQESYRTIIQANPTAERYVRIALAWHVFAALEAGHDLSFPPKLRDKTPFRRIAEVIDCYETLSTHATRVPTQRRGFLMYGWSPDNQHVLSGSCKVPGFLRETIRYTMPGIPDQTNMVIVDTETGYVQDLSSNIRGPAAWSPDGKFIAFPDPNDNLCIAAPDGGSPRTLVAGDNPYWSPQWSSDGQILYVTQGTPEWSLCSIDITETDPESAVLMEITGPYALCEDDHWVASAAPTALDIIDLSSGSVLYHHQSPWPMQWMLSMSPTGQELRLASGWSYIYTGPLVLDTHSKRWYKVFSHPVDQLLWSPDGSRLAIGVCRQIWVMDVDPNIPIGQSVGREILGNDLTRYMLEQQDKAIAADPCYPENYLERALLHLTLDQDLKAQSDMEQFHALATPNDRQLGHELLWWLGQYTWIELSDEVEFLTPHAERFMDRFPNAVSSYRHAIEQIAKWNEEEGNGEIAQRWRTRFKGPKDGGE